MPTISAQVKYPIELKETVRFPTGKEVNIVLEVHEEGVIARLEAIPDISAGGTTVAEARANLIKAVEDELAFLTAHREELSPNLRERLTFLERVTKE